MVCILLNADDKPGLWLARTLKQVCTQTVHSISAEELLYAPHFTCGFRNGQAYFSIILHNGFQFSSTSMPLCLNRITHLPQQHLTLFQPGDRDYVQSEQQAVFTFLLSTLPGSLFNNASGRGLCGAHRSYTEWLLLASTAGLTIGDFLFQEKQTFSSLPEESLQFSVIVFRGKCYSRSPYLSGDLQQALLRLLHLTAENIIEVQLQWVNGKAYFRNALINPTFADVNQAFIHDLNTLL
jgi:hypothetical protein